MNARFWTDYKGSPVHITLRPGGSIELFEGGPSEEGYCYMRSLFTFDGTQVISEWEENSRDCDGRLERYTESRCHVARLHEGWIDPDGLAFPAWERVDASQRDHSAEAAGY